MPYTEQVTGICPESMIEIAGHLVSQVHGHPGDELTFVDRPVRYDAEGNAYRTVRPLVSPSFIEATKAAAIEHSDVAEYWEAEHDEEGVVLNPPALPTDKLWVGYGVPPGHAEVLLGLQDTTEEEW